ncbi:MAG: FAD-dependent thymidylate synthase [Polyangiaceae bacterium]|nr:FAD-dependent thymidylate synthase [Polyangiaceae bacterium]
MPPPTPAMQSANPTQLSNSTGRVRRYVSNLDRNVFAISGLPEEVIAVLLARYSRSRDDLRSNLDQLLVHNAIAIGESNEDLAATSTDQTSSDNSTIQDRASAFHEKWVLGFGHDSVAEHAIIHLAVEQVSIIASKCIEDLRLGSFTEKSTRYVKFDTGSFADLHGLPTHLRQSYRATCETLFREYLDLFPQVQSLLEHILPTHPEESPHHRAVTIRAKTCDILRGLLPASTHTNLGITANARAVASLLCKMLSSPLEEVRTIGEQMQSEARTITPTLLKYIAPNHHRQTLRTRLQNCTDHAMPCGPRFDPLPPSPHVPVRIIRHDHDAMHRVALALCYDLDTHPDAATRMRQLEEQDTNTTQRIVEQAFASRGPRDPAPRALESSHITVELDLDYGAYRDLQRHRMLSPTVQILGCSLGPSVPQQASSLGILTRYEMALASVVPTWTQLAEYDPFSAQYVVPLAYRVRVLWTLNLREAFHVIELRSGKRGHPSYRRAAQALYHAICGVHPWLKDLIRVDLSDFDPARG